MYTYLLVNLFTIIIPFGYSFDRRIRFHKQWRHLFPAMLISGGLFIAWDVAFTNWGVWGFNARYLLGIEIINLPLEEWLFFIAIPYACVFTYEAFKVLIPHDLLGKQSRVISWVLILGLSIIAIFNLEKAYTATTFLLLSAFIAFLEIVVKPKYLGRFYLAYGVVILPFFIVNGILTGSWIDEEVVWYNDLENLGIRMGTIPVEDTFYGMLLILLNVFLFELLRSRQRKSS